MRISDCSSDVCSSDLWSAHDRSTDAVAYRQRSCWWCAGGAAALAGTPRTRHRAGVALSRRHEMAVGWCALHDLASGWQWLVRQQRLLRVEDRRSVLGARSEEHTSELQSLMRISYAVFCLKNKTNQTQ